MTAEVAVMNKGAVALAADSKVTVGSGITEKTYETVNKIFTLSKVHPVGIMIFGNADFMGFPWETIIKLYRQQKRNRSEPYVEAWGEDFWRFVRRFGPIREKDINKNIERVLRSIFGDFEREALIEAHRRGVAPASVDYENLLFNLAERKAQIILQNRRVALTRATARLIVNRYWKVILQVFDEEFPASRRKRFFDKAIELALVSLVRHEYSGQMSGVVIAGFGQRENFPVLVDYATDEYIGRRIKLQTSSPQKIAMDNSSGIYAFAQNEIVHRFMEGIDPGYQNVLRGLFRTALVGTNIKTFERWAPKSKSRDPKVRAQVERAAANEFTRILDKAKRYRRNAFTSPVLDMVALLPKDELAHLADSLVALTSLHRRVSPELETVGGPIDVALISKNDGFIWIKRKHYFKSELNPQFVMNYMRGFPEGGAR